MFVSVAVSDDVANMMLQRLQRRKKLHQRLFVQQRRQRYIHGDDVLSVHTGHAHNRLLTEAIAVSVALVSAILRAAINLTLIASLW